MDRRRIANEVSGVEARGVEEVDRKHSIPDAIQGVQTRISFRHSLMVDVILEPFDSQGLRYYHIQLLPERGSTFFAGSSTEHTASKSVEPEGHIPRVEQR